MGAGTGGGARAGGGLGSSGCVVNITGALADAGKAALDGAATITVI